MDRISDGIEWRSEQQELCLWLFHSRLEHEVALVFTARRLGDGEDFVSHGAWMLMANWQRINNRTERGGRGEVDARRAGAQGRKEEAPELGGGSR
jgi:hypothetical protein